MENNVFETYNLAFCHTGFIGVEIRSCQVFIYPFVHLSVFHQFTLKITKVAFSAAVLAVSVKHFIVIFLGILLKNILPLTYISRASDSDTEQA